jgi:hypothetical protein
VDLGGLIGGGWAHRERWLSDYHTPILEDEGIMPEPGRPTYFNIDGRPYRGELLEKGGRPRVRIIPEGG